MLQKAVSASACKWLERKLICENSQANKLTKMAYQPKMADQPKMANQPKILSRGLWLCLALLD